MSWLKIIVEYRSLRKYHGVTIMAVLVLLWSATPAIAQQHKAKNISSPFNIQGFKIGMTEREVKQVLRKKNFNRYETDFSDVFLYEPFPGNEVKLTFTCSKKGNILGKVDLSVPYTTEESAGTLSNFKEQLFARYGMPAAGESQPDQIDFCWGECVEGKGGTKLTANTLLPEQGTLSSLHLVLSNDGLFADCSSARTVKINRWLYQWIKDVRKFKTGMSLQEASLYYLQRYHDRLVPEEERDETAEQDAVRSYTVRDHEFFSGLDYESINFEGEGPGTIVMKFTADQADPKSRLNKRLYYSLFTTTAFKGHSFSDMQKKLDAFIIAYGKPGEVLQAGEGITAQWQTASGLVKVSVFDSGLISVEQSAPGIKDAYREAALRQLEEFKKNRFAIPIF